MVIFILIVYLIIVFPFSITYSLYLKFSIFSAYNENTSNKISYRKKHFELVLYKKNDKYFCSFIPLKRNLNINPLHSNVIPTMTNNDMLF